MAQTLAQAKENIWININKSMIEIWPSIQIIFELNELIQKSREAIEQIREKLEEKPTEATNIIKFLNSKKRYELE